MGVYDEGPDAVPCGYDKQRPDPKRPRFRRGPLPLIGWLVALVSNAVRDFADGLPGDGSGSHVRARRRALLSRPGTLDGAPEALSVQLDPFAGQEALEPAIDRFNAGDHRRPWLENRRVVISLTPRGPARAGP